MRALQTHCPGVCSWMMVVLAFLFSVSANAFFFVDEFISDVKRHDSAFHLWSETDASLCCCSGSSLCFDFTVNPCRFPHASCFPLSYTCGFFFNLHLSGLLWKISFNFLSSFPPTYCVHVCPEVQQPQSEGRLSINQTG